MIVLVIWGNSELNRDLESFSLSRSQLRYCPVSGPFNVMTVLVGLRVTGLEPARDTLPRGLKPRASTISPHTRKSGLGELNTHHPVYSRGSTIERSPVFLNSLHLFTIKV